MHFPTIFVILNEVKQIQPQNTMKTTEIKKQLKANFPQFKFSVTRKNAGYSESLNIVITNFIDIVKTKDQYKEIAPQIKNFVRGLNQESIDRDSSGDVLMGGNSYVFVDYKDSIGINCSL